MNMGVKRSSIINIKHSDDMKTPWITGSCFTPEDDKLVLCDHMNKSIKILDSVLTLKAILPLSVTPWDIAALDKNSVIVTLPFEKQLQIVQVSPSLQKSRIIIADKQCWGVAVSAGRIYVSCYTNRDDGEIHVYDFSGELRKKIRFNQKDYTIVIPKYIALSKSENKLFVANETTNVVSCLTTDGKIVYEYKDYTLSRPQGLYVDEKDYVIACGGHSINIQVISSAGTKLKTLLPSEDKFIGKPQCVTFRPGDASLVVGCENNENLFVYTLS